LGLGHSSLAVTHAKCETTLCFAKKLLSRQGISHTS
jgi:hypothetical protein